MEKQALKKENGKVLLEESTLIWWGKKKGLPVMEVAKEEPELIIILNRSKFFTVAPGVLLVAYRQFPTNHYLVKESTWLPLQTDWRKQIKN